ncbi:hypothetical protein B0T19DRAFT_457816 [Cercophora scortea]|uniref:Heterokaryon incompatibility domain-containing protein n=1 Tax=Cercophora scortea TaxID=314031 RepID=A0AAE0IXM5_9PEZI|nr:hypothetical protein B0T19DRAFT_457816 [Cercophora scortea]
MDHIPLPINGRKGAPRLVFPYHCDDDDACRQCTWDYTRFDAFPKRAQMNADDVCHGRVPNHDLPRACAFLQSWLWFGVLFETLGATKQPNGTMAGQYVIEDFLTTIGTRRYLSTKKLVAALATCEGHYKCREPETYQPGLTEALIYRLNKSSNLLNAAVASYAAEAAKLPVNAIESEHGHWVMNMQWVVLSCQILWQTIFNFYEIALDPAWSSPQGHDPSPLNLTFLNNFFHSDDPAWPWTPADIAQLPKDFISRLHLTYYPRAQLQPSPFDEAIPACPVVIVPVHTSNSCPPTCSTRTVPLASVQEAAAAKNCILLCQVTVPDDAKDGDVLVKTSPVFLNPYTKRCDILFVAFSHLTCWGLYSTAGNALPACQLKRLQSIADSLFANSPELQPVHFWIDTLSLPVPESMAARREKFSGDQWDVFTAAAFVVAPDPYLHMSVVGNPYEIISRVRFSEWKHSTLMLEQSLASRRPIWGTAFVRIEETWRDQSLIMPKVPKPRDVGLPDWEYQEKPRVRVEGGPEPPIAFSLFNLIRFVRAFAVDIRAFGHSARMDPVRVEVQTPANSESRLKKELMMEVYRVALYLYPNHYFFLDHHELRLLKPLWNVLSFTYAGAGNLNMDINAVRVRLERMGGFWIDYMAQGS